MGEEFKDFEVEAPVLTLEPDLTEEKEEIAKKEPEKPQPAAIFQPTRPKNLRRQFIFHISKSFTSIS